MAGTLFYIAQHEIGPRMQQWWKGAINIIVSVTVIKFALSCEVGAGPNFIELLTGKQIFVLTIAEKFGC